MLLIVKNGEIVKKSYELIQNLISYKSFIENNLLSLQFLLVDNKSLNEKFSEMLKDFEKNRAMLQKLANDDTENRKKIKEVKDQFSKSRVEEFLKCRYPSDDFANLAKNYLTSIS